MTLVVNLFGGPGTGKSTTAARLFGDLKTSKVNVELVREYVKDWAWGDRRVTPLNQLHLLGEQSYRESLLYGKVDVIVTDSPLMLCAFYQKHYGGEDYLLSTTKAFIEHSRRSAGTNHKNIFLSRTKPYDPRGRYENEQQAIAIDVSLYPWLLENDTIDAKVSYDDYGSLLELVHEMIRS
jgi:hypothetical protein